MQIGRVTSISGTSFMWRGGVQIIWSKHLLDMLKYSDENHFDLNQERQTHTKFTSSEKVLEVISNVSHVKKAISFCIANINVLDIMFQPWTEGGWLRRRRRQDCSFLHNPSPAGAGLVSYFSWLKFPGQLHRMTLKRKWTSDLNTVNKNAKELESTDMEK